MITRGGASLRTVNSSKPQLSHSESRQSVAASDDYFSFSDQSSTKSSGSKLTVVQYATPQSHRSREPSPSLPPTQEEEEMTPKAPERGMHDAGIRRSRATSVPFSDTKVSEARSSPDNTDRVPGTQDMPYIRFAIEQLTRDEEVAGVGRQDSTASTDYPVDRFHGEGSLSHTPEPSKEPPTPGPERPLSTQSERSDVIGSLFVAAEQPDDNLYPSLDYVPIVLRPWALAAVILCCLLMITGVAFCNAWSQRYDGLWNYDGVGTSRYFVFQFLPQLLAVLLIIWIFVIQAAVYRTIPFLMMATERQQDSVLQKLSILPRNFLFPDFSHFKNGELLIGISQFIIWLTNFFAIPLMSCLFQTKHYTIGGRGVWRWVSVQPVGWTLVAVYALVTIALLLLMFRYCRSWTGLIWDPVSIADLIPLIQRSNILHDFERSETAHFVTDTVAPRFLRLGYWKTSDKKDVFYGIGEEHAPIRSPSLHGSKNWREKQSDPVTALPDIQEQGGVSNDSFQNNLHSPTVRYRWMTSFLKDSSLIAWTAIVFALFIAFVVVSFVNDAIPRGFVPRLSTLASDDGFSASNFVFSFIPAFIGTFLFLAWQPIDIYFRALQPFLEMSSPEGATADNSLLLSYQSGLPLGVTLSALLARHFKVAWISFMSVASLAIPVLSGGIFIALWYPSESKVRITTCLPAFYALVAFCALYAVSFLVIWPGRKRYLPHDISTLADLFSFLYQSPLLSDKLLREPRTKTDLVTRLIISPPGGREIPRYGFGVYCGRSGKEHLGIDRLHRPGKPDMLITTATMKPRRASLLSTGF
ncbi:hypothetical protein AOR_1_260084 [Paecilomyces variotii No. 5]|uniref:Phosphoribosylaminoimidazole-succinocarboxamide synthase n=1 Tax=Byssochlamys spectabilis (strain No. 5 / NBRC 109023) TaxID=1356009 RepID=V5FUW2_BYSSN|nr:hypothetical protein AOR_1_260084 [Paecilomyces variotii No. 5]